MSPRPENRPIEFARWPTVYRQVSGESRTIAKSTFRRWYLNGVLGGECRLQVTYLSGKVFTTRANIHAFLKLRDALSQPKKRRRANKVKPNPVATNVEADLAELNRMGIMRHETGVMQ